MDISMDKAKALLDRGIAEAQEFIKDPSKIDDILVQLENKLREVPAIGEHLSDLPLMVSMVKGYVTREYSAVSPKVIAVLVGSFIYLVKKKDIIPDNIPVVGIADDLAVLGLALNLCKPELQAFKAFRDGEKADSGEAGKIQIKAVKLYANGFMTQPFAMGGESMEGLDPAVKYRSSLQNFVIDTGKEVILVDTGLPAETPDAVPDENTQIYMGKKVNNYMDALAEAGYTPEQVTKILITHKHLDHTGELSHFPNAEIYAARAEAEAEELKSLPNVIPVDFTDGAYYNFPASQKIAEGVTYIYAKGHTTGNSIVIVEADGLFYMLHGDVTYTDEALYENKLSTVFEDLPAARETLDAVREFVRNNPTIYLSTHTPLGYENLDNLQIVSLDFPPETIPVGEIESAEATGKYICSVCGYVYDPAEHDGVAFEDLPDDWKCPRCKQSKEKFNKA
ncbi:MAG: MBL fold metallo-hydrolase [Eubacterium sp.]|nr:MBL fold metallo-hydrolase [Eubacterium sp.]